MSQKYCSFCNISVGFEDRFCHSCERHMMKEKRYCCICVGRLKEDLNCTKCDENGSADTRDEGSVDDSSDRRIYRLGNFICKMKQQKGLFISIKIIYQLKSKLHSRMKL